MFNLKLHAHFELHLVLYLYLLSGIKGGFKSYASREDTVFEGKGPSRQLDLIDPTPASSVLGHKPETHGREGRGREGPSHTGAALRPRRRGRCLQVALQREEGADRLRRKDTELVGGGAGRCGRRVRSSGLWSQATAERKI